MMQYVITQRMIVMADIGYRGCIAPVKKVPRRPVVAVTCSVEYDYYYVCYVLCTMCAPRKHTNQHNKPEARFSQSPLLPLYSIKNHSYRVRSKKQHRQCCYCYFTPCGQNTISNTTFSSALSQFAPTAPGLGPGGGSRGHPLRCP